MSDNNKIKVIEKIKFEPMTKAKYRLMSDHMWWGMLLMRLEEVPKDSEWFTSIGAEGSLAGTDGIHLYYDKSRFDKLPLQQQIWLLAHEVGHCVFQSWARQGSRNAKLFNMASDYVINLMLEEDKIGKRIPDIIERGKKVGGVLYDEQYKGMYTEQVYNLIRNDIDNQMKLNGWDVGCTFTPSYSGKDKDGKDIKGDLTVGSGLSKEDIDKLTEDWKIAIEEATLRAKQAGKGSENIDRAIEGVRDRRESWMDIIREFLVVPGDYSWAKANRRYVGRGLYLPSMSKARMGCIAFILDTSGSIGGKMLEDFASLVNGILHTMDAWPERVVVIYADAEVKGMHECDESTGVYFKPKGGGGTLYQPAFDYIKQEDMNPVVVFYLGDLECGDSPKDPMEYPVVWVCPEEYKKGMAFGRVAVYREE